jgi:hypothetical protein
MEAESSDLLHYCKGFFVPPDQLHVRIYCEIAGIVEQVISCPRCDTVLHRKLLQMAEPDVDPADYWSASLTPTKEADKKPTRAERKRDKVARRLLESVFGADD